MYVSLRTIFSVLLGSLFGRGFWILLDYWCGHEPWLQTRIHLEELVVVLVGVAIWLSVEAAQTQ
jgi:hypothetical protein